MRSENRFEQYDLNLELPAPLIAREHRFTLAERIAADGTCCCRWTGEMPRHCDADRRRRV
jgi:N-methylhydantoinase A/oxoprolinase/acetone carboxylase beta subunit